MLSKIIANLLVVWTWGDDDHWKK